MEHLLSYLCNPVYPFTFLSGYGLYISYSHGKRNAAKRLWGLYLKYWVSLLLFVPLACLIGNRDVYPGTWLHVAENVTSLRTSYNGTVWFLFPYSCLVLFSPYIFSCIGRMGRKGWLCTVLFILVTCSLLLHFYGSYFIDHHYVYLLEHVYELLIPFLIGVFCAKEVRYSRLAKRGGAVTLILLATLALLVPMHQWPLGLLYPVYMLMLFLCIALLSLPRFLSQLLRLLGRRATAMWFVHAYFCWYLFSAQFYALRYSLLIYGGLVVVSYIAACLVDTLTATIDRCLQAGFKSAT